jgi:hypothetical protein
VLDAGAEDMRDDGEDWEVMAAPEAHEAVLAGAPEGRYHRRNPPKSP